MLLQFYYSLKRKKINPYKPIILITGCSSGLGLELAKKLSVLTQYRVIATARPQSLERLQKHFATLPSDRANDFWIRPLDVTLAKTREDLFLEIDSVWKSGVDILINNAGISYRSVIEHMDELSEFHQMNTNYLGPMSLIRRCLPHMRLQGRGKIINISSVSGMMAMPTMASYSASKHALEGASEALWYEMRPLGISVTLLQPGFIHSESFRNVYYSENSLCGIDPNGPYCDYYRYMSPFVENMMKRSRATPERIAKLAIKVIQTQDPPLRIPATLDALFFYYLRRMLPRRIFLRFLYWNLPHVSLWGRAYSKARWLR